ncbi:MAG: PEP-CTERM sorting domain-containing protein [Leptolyngbya sp. SIO1D8]|nr:PEP-CTERM sorting domain-containing protein [Leptolyngbya sp. SIO1D8]
MNIRTLTTLVVPSAFLLGAIAVPAEAFNLTPLSTYETGKFDEGAAEIATFAPGINRLFVTNAEANTIDVLDLSNPNAISKLFEIDLSPYGDGINSVAYNSYGSSGYIAAAVEAATAQDPGSVVFFDLEGIFQNALTVGSLPDMLTFTVDGNKLLVANEGEPNDDYTVDPEGSISLIDVSGGIWGLTDADVKFADFNAFDSQKDALINQGVRIFGPGASVSQDLEPEYIAVSEDGTKAYVSLQENNAIAILNLETEQIEEIVPLGFKDYSLPGNGLDASNRDDAINIENYPVLGMYQPDAIATYTVDGQTYIVTANEGDSRDYDGFSEEERINDLDLDPTAFSNAAALQEDEVLGRLNITTTLGDTDGDGDFDELYAYGARSFSIWDVDGNLVWDSGDQFEQILADVLPDDFNSNNDENQSFDSRSDDKGPEPEGVTVGMVGDLIYAFIGLERIGGVMVYDVTDPENPTFVTYTNNRNFDVEFNVDEEGDPDPTPEQLAAALDLGPEGLIFINAEDSPNGQSLLVVTNEVSGTTTVYAVDDDAVSVPEPAYILGLLALGTVGFVSRKHRLAKG